MSAQDRTEKVLRELHVLLSKSEPYSKEPSKVLVDKDQMIALLTELNSCMYAIMDEHELTIRSRDKAEREFRKHGDQIVLDASRKAEDIYAASVMYKDEALNRVMEIMQQTSDKVEVLYKNMSEKIKQQQRAVKTNQLELKYQLQDLTDTNKYLKLIEERNKEIQKQKEEGMPKERISHSEKSIYANRQTEIKVNTEYLEKMGYSVNEAEDEEEQQKEKKAELNIRVNLPNKPDEQGKSDNKKDEKQAKENNKKDEKKISKQDEEEMLKAELDAEYFEWIDLDNPTGENKPAHKGWKGLISSKK